MELSVYSGALAISAVITLLLTIKARAGSGGSVPLPADFIAHSDRPTLPRRCIEECEIDLRSSMRNKWPKNKRKHKSYSLR